MLNKQRKPLLCEIAILGGELALQNMFFFTFVYAFFIISHCISVLVKERLKIKKKGA